MAPGRSTRRDLALGRVLDPVRLAAEERLERFLATGLELMSAGPSGDFTVQEVVERSGQSMRSFYQYFDGKYDLMLAVFEAVVHATAAHLREAAAAHTDPVTRLRTFVVDYARQCHREGACSSVLVDFAQTVLTEHPDHAHETFQPLVDLLQELLAAGSTAGTLRPGLGADSTASVMVQVITFHEMARAISGTPEAGAQGEAEALWDLFLDGLGLLHPAAVR